MPSIWVLIDRRPGNASQALGVAEALGLPFEVKRLDYTRFVALPNGLKGERLVGISATSQATLVPPWPALVISAGRRAAHVARVVKRRSGGRSAVIQLMHPGHGADEFDLIIAPEHDRISGEGNVVRTLCAPNRVHAGVLATEAERWRHRLESLPAPRIGVLVGGAAGWRRVGRRAVRELADRASAAARGVGGSLLVTTSRRTGRRLARLLESGLAAHHYFHRWRPTGDNPYLAYLGLCDGFIVTGDSVSMCSEACATGRPVYVLVERGWAKPRHRRFHDALFRKGITRPLDMAFESWSYTPVNAAMEVARTVRERFGLPETS